MDEKNADTSRDENRNTDENTNQVNHSTDSDTSTAAQTPHKRRVHYSGSYPKRYEEKYKELHPEKYPEMTEHVIEKGSTPAGMHISIFVNEILGILKIKPGQTGLDATLGYGGHTRAMLACLKGSGHIYGLDVDPIELEKTRQRLQSFGYGSDLITTRHMNFADVRTLADVAGGFDFVLADLGVSSMQIDNPGRGFSYKTDGPLDLRLNPDEGITAAGRLADITEEELAGMLVENADEPYAGQIAREVIKRRRGGRPIETTTDFAEAIKAALSFLPKDGREDIIRKSARRSFQALRIDINNEFEALYAFLSSLPEVTKPGGRIVILTFHSGEDRLVKQSFKQFYKEGLYSDIARDVVRPTREECARNSRARSTKLRWAVRA